MMIPARIPSIIEKFYSERVWRIETTQNDLYITFDDGPHPTITPAVLAMLRKYDAKATFFCIGDRVKRYPEVYNQILAEGHAVGNHTQHHLNGWKVSDEAYLADVREADEFINTTLFRPPYGRIKRSQGKKILALGKKIVMWTVLSGDYSNKLTPQDVAKRVSIPFEKGAIYLFHDLEKAAENMFFALGKLLEDARQQGFSMKKIEGLEVG
jgi:peptidoglycan/xylan/chitin deacetylase (PgdA/CDA1 family)